MTFSQIRITALSILIFSSFSAGASSRFGSAQSSAPRSNQLPHILPDAPSAEYERILGDNSLVLLDFETGKADPVRESISAGQRNLNWLKYMNQNHDEAHRILWTKRGDLTGSPIESPKSYNAESVTTELMNLKKDVPPSIKAIVFDGADFTKDPQVDMAEYIKWARRIDRNYQTAARWIMMQPYLGELANRKVEDVRGFYYLNKMDGLDAKLRNFDGLGVDEQKQLKGYLIQICVNTSGDLSGACGDELDRSVSDKHVYEYFSKYNPSARDLWNSYFTLQGTRDDVQWTHANQNIMMVPFAPPDVLAIHDYLQINIEDEWKWGDWQLKLNFTPNALTHVEFEPGVTPHVNGIAGNIITMDANSPITEWDVQWTIRHEYGHVLGFPDCYVEFYDKDIKAMVNYQLDTSNLMCSRMGTLQEKHFTELKKAYLR